MAYNNYLIKVGTYVIPANKYIKFDSYQVSQHGQDLDSYRDASGMLHRTALTHTAIKVEFETPAMLTNTDVATLMTNIRNNFTDSVEKKANVEVYIPETDSYVTKPMYMPDIEFSIYGSYGEKLHYNPFRLAFIEY